MHIPFRDPIKVAPGKPLSVILLLSMCAFGAWSQLPKPAADKTENSSRIREFLQAGSVKEAILFADECLKTESDREFYLEWILALLKISKQTDRAIECARLLDEAGGEKKADAAAGLAELYLESGRTEDTLRWMAAAAERGLKDIRLFGDEKWGGLKEDARGD
ncbi:MAG: hypothetical protein JW843_04150 [Candidatus Aminicenantes bacterium]|nr:hypothetical protein [Candidatus Aminicenantes bacterium]